MTSCSIWIWTTTWSIWFKLDNSTKTLCACLYIHTATDGWLYLPHRILFLVREMNFCLITLFGYLSMSTSYSKEVFTVRIFGQKDKCQFVYKLAPINFFGLRFLTYKFFYFWVIIISEWFFLSFSPFSSSLFKLFEFTLSSQFVVTRERDWLVSPLMLNLRPAHSSLCFPNSSLMCRWPLRFICQMINFILFLDLNVEH